MTNKQNYPTNRAASIEKYTPQESHASGLAHLQRSTSATIHNVSEWGFENNELKIKRFKLDNHNWQLTVINPKTRKTILQAVGNGDTVFANEDNLARMAKTLMEQGLSIRTQFDD